MTNSIFPRNVSEIEYSGMALNSLLVDESRRSFVLARIAIAQYDSDEFSVNAHKALEKLHYASFDGILQPPLSEALANEIEAAVEGYHGSKFGVGSANEGVLALLCMAVDQGSRPSV